MTRARGFWRFTLAAVLALALLSLALPSGAAPAPPSPSVGTYDQCSNDLGTGYTSGDLGCRWINGNLNANNSTYYEGDATVQRLWLTGMVPGSQHTVTVKYGTTKGGKHAYDFLTTWNWSEDWISDADRCQDITGCEAAPELTLAIPKDANARGFDGAASVFSMRGGSLTSATTPAIVSGTYAGDSETVITVGFTAASSGSMCTTKGSVTTCDAALWFGAHVAETASWTGIDGTTGATTIPGSPYHVALDAVDGTAIGSRDNQMQSNAIILPTTLKLVKTVTNDNGGTAVPDDWTLSAAAASPTDLNFSNLGGSGTFQNVHFGVGYVLSESAKAGYTAGNWLCDKTGVLSGSTVTLAMGDAVTCTITNDDIGPTLTLVKTVVNDNGGTKVVSDFPLFISSAAAT
ncbi:MAG: hypothetical protein ACYC7H_16450, partial [Chloroflexota bacterium]